VLAKNAIWVLERGCLIHCRTTAYQQSYVVNVPLCLMSESCDMLGRFPPNIPQLD